MIKICLSICLIFFSIFRVNAEDEKSNILNSLESAANDGIEAIKNPEQSSTMSGSWATGEEQNLTVLDEETYQTSSTIPSSFQPPELNIAPETPVPSPINTKEDLILSMLESDHDLSNKEYYVLIKTLSQYKMTALQDLHDSGVRLFITEDYSDFPKTKYGSASQYYSHPKIYMRKDYVEGSLFTQIRTMLKNLASHLMGEVAWGGPRETIMHEMGHAWDYHLGLKKGEWGEKNDPQLQRLYQNYQYAVKRNSYNRWSYYAHNTEKPSEYLAEGYRMYGQSEKSRKILRQKDPEFYAWLQPRADKLYDL